MAEVGHEAAEVVHLLGVVVGDALDDEPHLRVVGGRGLAAGLHGLQRAQPGRRQVFLQQLHMCTTTLLLAALSTSLILPTEPYLI